MPVKTPRKAGHPTPARAAALAITQKARLENRYIQDVSRLYFEKVELPMEERAFAILLSQGVMATCGVLDELINGCLKSPSDIEPKVRDALRISTYELFFLEKADHAAVDQGVELVRSVQPAAAGVGNFVLRRLSEKRSDFPFGDTRTSLSAFCRENGFPVWLAQRLSQAFGDAAARTFITESQEPAPLYFMVNRARAKVGNTLQALRMRGIEFEPYHHPDRSQSAIDCFVLKQRNSVGDELFTKLLEEGVVLISDASAQAVASLVVENCAPGARFLEVGAGRGTKTIMLQDAARALHGMPLELTALDYSADKIKIHRKRCAKAKTPVTKECMADATKIGDPSYAFRVGLLELAKPGIDSQLYDAVFIDAPCSGSGTLRRHPEIRWRMGSKDVANLAETGLAMLRASSTLVRKGGVLVYATCSILSEEDEGTIDAFLATDEGRGYERIEGASFRANPSVGGPDIHFAQALRRI